MKTAEGGRGIEQVIAEPCQNEDNPRRGFSVEEAIETMACSERFVDI